MKIKNKDLENFYSKVYERNEKNHYSTLKLKNRPQEDADEAFKVIE